MLTVYRASAGAGKTHRLTGEYLKLLFTTHAAYRHILAVTFTNKATDEMKSRIIEELHKLSTGKPSQHLTSLAQTYSIDEWKVRAKAKSILTAILHDYSSFNISTIDRFFQQTMRAFSREIGMQGGYSIEMDQDLVLAEAVDNMLAGLDKADNTELLEWLLRFAMEKVENGATWNPRLDIINLSRELFKENYRTNSAEISKDTEDKKSLEIYKSQLYAIVNSCETRAMEVGNRALRVMEKQGLAPTDFVSKSKSPLLLFKRLAEGEMKEPTATFCALCDNVCGWYAKKDSPDLIARIDNAFNSGLNECVHEVCRLFDNMVNYHTAKEILRYYYTMGILSDVSAQIAAYRTEKNILLIADTTELLSRIIDGSDTPFIYEKTGTRIDHYMIDEFQDTSRMQWNNFRPLLAESLAHGNENLIVGDVKQSIYRFRNSDWSLLDQQIRKDFRYDQVTEETLAENWRSSREIVLFNNRIFKSAPRILQGIYNEDLAESSLDESAKNIFGSRIVQAYTNSDQAVPPQMQNTVGHVSVEFLPDEDDWRETAISRLPGVLEQLQDAGYAPKDIAILVRTNREAGMIADALLLCKEERASEKYIYDIISDDALFVANSTTVRFLIAMLRHLNSPGSKSYRQMAVFAYSRLSENPGEAEDFPLEMQEALPNLSKYALYETIEALIRLFPEASTESEQVFVQAFLDMIYEFAQRDNSDTERFLEWWDNTGTYRTIATPDGQNAIRILTIHKSKGLGFKAVILPLCEWEIDHRATKSVILWSRTPVSPFNRLSITPLHYSRNLAKTHFAADYFDERLQAAIDNLNTLYVAFTRAKEELVVISPQKQRINSIAGLLLETLRQDEEIAMSPDETIYERGHTRPAPPPSASAPEHPSAEEIQMSRLNSVAADNRLRLRLNSSKFALGKDSRKQGAQMHEILSAIRTLDDINSAIEDFRQRGLVNTEEAATLAADFNKLLRRPEVAHWFDGRYTVMNEAEILSSPVASHRPDRVMIKENAVIIVDYKFGLMESRQHHDQVRTYIDLVRRMGYESVEGFLWYITLDKIEEVKIRTAL
jgi:ATP-dependent exoDNAse (exonuclease V) beta subunit